MMAKVVQLILTYSRRGLGEPDDPIRMVPQLFTLRGELVAECDPTPKGRMDHPDVTFNPAPLYRLEQP
jgi:hypothetical protein